MYGRSFHMGQLEGVYDWGQTACVFMAKKAWCFMKNDQYRIFFIVVFEEMEVLKKSDLENWELFNNALDRYRILFIG